MSNGQNNPNQGNQKHGRDDQKHHDKQRQRMAPRTVTGPRQQTGDGAGNLPNTPAGTAPKKPTADQ